jgi:hypothetical protein
MKLLKLFFTSLAILAVMPAFSQDPLDVQDPLGFENSMLAKGNALIKIRNAVSNEYDEFFYACEKNRTSELNQRLDNLRIAISRANDSIEFANKAFVFPSYYGLSPESETNHFLSMMKDACGNELSEIIRLKSTGDDSAENQSRIKTINRTLDDKLIASVEAFERVLERTLIRESRAHLEGREAYCNWLDGVLNEVKTNFESLKATSHSSLQHTWVCSKPFPGAEQTLCKELSGKSIEVKFQSGNDYTSAAKNQRELYYRLAGCMHQGCYHDLYTIVEGSRKNLRTKAAVDNGSESYFEFWTGEQYYQRKWSCKVGLRNAGGEYVISVVIR